MMDRANLVIRGRSELTKRRQQADVLLKKAMKGDVRAKRKLYKEFGIKLYSSGEVERYVQERVSKEYSSGGKSTDNGPTGVTRKKEAKSLTENGIRQTRSRSSLSRAKLRQKTKRLVKRV
jgi:hypothetical protein